MKPARLLFVSVPYCQPPSGGCVLKPIVVEIVGKKSSQPPSGGCVLKHKFMIFIRIKLSQPPSGGCVLKPSDILDKKHHPCPAAFGRLCVETDVPRGCVCVAVPAAFGRLCVETRKCANGSARAKSQPPSGGCVLKRFAAKVGDDLPYPAAFGRLCVETPLF